MRSRECLSSMTCFAGVAESRYRPETSCLQELFFITRSEEPASMRPTKTGGPGALTHLAIWGVASTADSLRFSQRLMVAAASGQCHAQ